MKFLICGILTFALTACATKEARLHDQQMIEALMIEKRAEAESCYRAEADRNPQIPSGKIKIRFDQDRNGQLSHPRLMDGFTFSEPVYQCILGKAKTWRTSEPATFGPVDLSFSFQNLALHGDERVGKNQ